MSLELTITIAVSVAYILFQAVFSLWRRTKKSPVWVYNTRRIVGPGAELSGDITILYRGQPVPQVSVTEVSFANIGRGLIREWDVTKPIIVRFRDDITILQEPIVVRLGRPDIEFSATLEGKGVKLSFDQLDYQDGAVVEILHTGDEHTKISLQGTIAGVPKGITQSSYVYAVPGRRWAWLAIAIVNCVMAAILVGTFIPAIQSDISQGRFSISATILFGVIILLFILGFIWSLLQLRKRLPSWIISRK